jgi:hypothetical protein
MKEKRTAQLRHQVASTRRISVSSFFNLRVSICLALVCAAAISAQANIIIVTNTNDSGPGSLRQALADANDGDTINFAVTGTIGLTSGELVVDKSITISGPGADNLAINVNVNVHFRVFNIRPGTNVSISQLKIMHGDVRVSLGDGGAILNDHAVLALNNCTVDSNSAARGGGIYNDGQNGTATLTISNSRVTYNTSTNVTRAEGGGIYNNAANGSAVLTIVNSTISHNSAIGTDFFHNEVGFAGGIYNSGGTLTITNSTVSENHAGGGFNAVPGFAGGIYSEGTLTISNSTLDYNTAAANGNGGAGGGIFNLGVLMIAESTLSDNRGTYGAEIYNDTGTVSIGNTILNRGDALGGNIYNASGTITSEGYNISSDDGSGYLTGPGDQINTNPLLGPLQNNGGPTLTHALLPASPAINTGNPNFTPPPFYDQRGSPFVRVLHSRIDVGSFEVQPPPRPTPAPRPETHTPTPTATGTPSPTPTPTATPRVTPRPRPSPPPRP